MENKLLDSKKLKFGIYESALASILFVIYNFLFIQLYSFIPKSVRANDLMNFVASFFLEGMFAVAAITVACTRKIDLKAASGMNKKINSKMVWLGFWISVVCLIGFGDVTNLFLQILEMLGYSSVLSNLEMTTFWQYLGYVLVSCVTPAVCEELLFRGTILSGFRQYGMKTAIVLSALIFTFMHGNAEQTVHQFIIGVIVGYIFYKSGNLWLGVIIHFFNNFLSVTASYILSLSASSETVVATETTVTAGQFIVGVISTIAFAYFAYVLSKLLISKLLDENEKVNGKLQENTNLQVVKIDGEESVVEVAINGEVAQQVDIADGEMASEKPEKEPLSVGCILMFAISGLYLAFEWIAALLIGFGV